MPWIPLLQLVASVFMGERAPAVSGSVIKGGAIAALAVPFAIFLVEHGDEVFTCVTYKQAALGFSIYGLHVLWAYLVRSPRQGPPEPPPQQRPLL